jgi:Flp pilus assembly secretin CpaC
MRHFVLCVTLLIGLPAVGRGDDPQQCPYLKQCCQAGKKCCADAKKCCAQADKKSCAESAACQAKVAVCPGQACQATTDACPVKASGCQVLSTACPATAACESESVACQKGRAPCADCPLDARIEHLQEAVRHLEAAGLESEAKAVSQALCREVLAKKQSELVRLQEEIDALRQAAGQLRQVILHVQIAEVSLTNLSPDSLGLIGAATAQAHSACAASNSSCPDGTPQARFTLHHCDRESIAELVASLRKENILKVLAEPTLVTLDGRPVSFTDGGEVPAPLVRPDESVEIQFKPFGTQIDALARTLGDDKVHLEIHPRYSSLIPALGVEVQGVHVPGMIVREVKIGCDVELGKTVVIGGPVQQRMENQIKLGKQITARNDVQMLFLVTPEVITAAPPLPTAQLPSQTQAE